MLRMKNGMSTMPSDVSSPDDALSVSSGVIFENGEHRVIQDPAPVTPALSMEVLFIHDFANYTHLIGKDGNSLCCADVTGYEYDPETPVTETPFADITGIVIRNITAIGNTLIVSTDAGVHYFLWKNDEYIDLGTGLSDIEAEYSIEDATIANHRFSTAKYADIEEFVTNGEDFKNALVGHIADVQNGFKDKGYFLYPFWVRICYQLYDGQNVMLTAPVLILPCVRYNSYILCIRYHNYQDHSPGYVRYYPHAARLKVKINNDLSDWKDIITGVDVYISNQVCPFEPEDDYSWFEEDPEQWPSGDSTSNQGSGGGSVWDSTSGESDSQNNDSTLYTTSWDGIRETSGTLPYKLFKSVDPSDIRQTYDESNYKTERERVTLVGVPSGGSVWDPDPVVNYNSYAKLLLPTHKSDDEIIKELMDNSQFYRLIELPLDEITDDWFYVDEKIRKHTLLNLVNQHVLEHDDYYNHCPITAETSLVYNGRLHLGNITRGFYEGYDHFMPSGPISSTDGCRGIGVIIDSNDGEKTIYRHFPRPTLSSPYSFRELLGYWFYYPDPRAKEVVIIKGDGYRVRHSLKQHPWLNGAYLFLALPSGNAHNLSGFTQDGGLPLPDDEWPDDNDNDTEHLENQIIISEADNPFVFTSEGSEEIGSGKIIGLVPNTEALSEGQFGQFPLYAFTSEGIWALSLDSEGRYDYFKPASRHVCNNTKSIVQTDNAVFFSTAKGFMRMIGKQVVNVSAQMMGKAFDVSMLNDNALSESCSGIMPFYEFLKDSAFVAYDYRNSRLWICRADSSYAYVYSMRDNAFALKMLPKKIISANILYPDIWLQDEDGKMLSMTHTPDINEDETSYDALLITRPVNLGSPFYYKQIRQIEHLLTKDTSHITLSVYGSNDTIRWHKVTALRERPWKYYRFLVRFTNLSAADAYGGMMLMTEEQQTERLHPEDRLPTDTQTYDRPTPRT